MYPSAFKKKGQRHGQELWECSLLIFVLQLELVLATTMCLQLPGSLKTLGQKLQL